MNAPKETLVKTGIRNLAYTQPTHQDRAKNLHMHILFVKRKMSAAEYLPSSQRTGS